MPKTASIVVAHAPIGSGHRMAAEAIAAELTSLAGETVDVRTTDEKVLRDAVGSLAEWLRQLANGIDDRPVEPNREVKSVGHEETFAEDLYSREQIWREIVRLSDGVASRLRRQGVGARTITLKLRFATFETISRSVTLPSAVTTAPAITAAVEPLLAPIDPSPGIRLVGVSGSNLGPPTEQLSLFDDDAAPSPEAWNSASSALDDIRNRFGTAAIGPASTMRGGSLRPVRRGEQQWGPDQRSTEGAP